MITSIELQLKSGEMVDGVISNVNQVSDSLKSQLKNAEAHYDSQNAACQADVMELSAGLSQAMVDVDKYQALMDMDSATLSSRVEELDTKRVSLDARRAMLEVLHTQRDAERVIKLVRSSLEKVGIDPETGIFDATVIEMGKSRNQFDRVKIIRSIIEKLTGEHPKDGAPILDIIERAKESGIGDTQTEHMIKKMSESGEIYQPSAGHYKLLKGR